MTNNSRPVGPLSREIGAILRGALARRGKKQVDLAAVMGVAQGQVSRLLNGSRVLDFDQVDAACHLLDLDIVAVVAEAELAIAPGRPTTETEEQVIARMARRAHRRRAERSSEKSEEAG